MRNFTAIGQTVAEIWRFSSFLNGGRRHLAFAKCGNLRKEGSRVSKCVTVPNFGVIGQSVADIWSFSSIFLANVNSRSRSLFAVARPSVSLSVCRLSVKIAICQQWFDRSLRNMVR